MNSAAKNAGNRRWKERNPALAVECEQKWRKANPGKVKTTREACKLRSYGLTRESYDELWQAQGETCGACAASEPRGGRWTIDHCHDTGVVRGILCQLCNSALGHAGDSIDTLLDLANYLKKGKE